MGFQDHLQLAESLAKNGMLTLGAAPAGQAGYNGLWTPEPAPDPTAKFKKIPTAYYSSTPKTANSFYEQFMQESLGEPHVIPDQALPPTTYWILKGLSWPVTDPDGTYAKLVRCKPGTKESIGLEYPCEVMPCSSSASSALPTPSSSTGTLSTSVSPPMTTPLPSLKGWPKPADYANFYIKPTLLPESSTESPPKDELAEEIEKLKALYKKHNIEWHDYEVGVDVASSSKDEAGLFLAEFEQNGLANVPLPKKSQIGPYIGNLAKADFFK